jgi:hypothetical protein
VKFSINQLRKIIKEEILRLTETEYHGSGFSPELGLDSMGAEAHLENIQEAQANEDKDGERAAILAYLEWLSDSLYDESRSGGAPESRFEDSNHMFDDAAELDAYVQRASADPNWDDNGWIEMISNYAKQSNPSMEMR